MYRMCNEKTADPPCASLSFARSYRKKSIRTALMDVVASGLARNISRRMSSTAQMLQPLFPNKQRVRI